MIAPITYLMSLDAVNDDEVRFRHENPATHESYGCLILTREQWVDLARPARVEVAVSEVQRGAL